MKKIIAILISLPCLASWPAGAVSLNGAFDQGQAIALATNKSLLALSATTAKAAAQTKSVGSAGISWVKIPGTTAGQKFMMGSTELEYAQPVHGVSVASFYISQSPVTNKQYAPCVSAKACTPSFPGCNPEVEGDNKPVTCVTWQQAVDFAKWIDARLPSEAEYEYAATNAGQAVKFPWGNSAPTCQEAVHSGCDLRTQPVCSRPAGNTQQGLCDMVGDVWEWTQDIWHASYSGAPVDGKAWQGGSSTYRVIRGGGFSGDLHSGSRYGIGTDPTNFSGDVGFRVVK